VRSRSFCRLRSNAIGLHVAAIFDELGLGYRPIRSQGAAAWRVMISHGVNTVGENVFLARRRKLSRSVAGVQSVTALLYMTRSRHVLLRDSTATTRPLRTQRAWSRLQPSNRAAGFMLRSRSLYEQRKWFRCRSLRDSVFVYRASTVPTKLHSNE